ncbi:hypothetical protein Lrub_2369 [Legionella rubrilucens]|uniref:Uncharacterized protein n=1 Tax=Legionella rubrilucens TaxID=458 RepID=A0A0W0XMA6_9GAMM|nr:hypothetical protein [Legionella rubrilucens]KTD45572.1 hypothetical protein Lrub_2369 [Legionella rubrilucens]
MANISRKEIMELSHESTVGLIYSRSDLHQYLVELIHNDKTDYIHEGIGVAVFPTMEEALRSAKRRGAKCFFLCLDNTYDECGAEPATPHYNYLPIRPSRKH